jgi:hypothetical protein
LARNRALFTGQQGTLATGKKKEKTMDRNANRLATKGYDDEGDIRSRNHGGHSERNGVKRANRISKRRGRSLDDRWEKKNRI